MKKTALGGLVTGCLLCAVSPAFADAKRCVAQNNDGVQKRDEHHLLAARESYRACVAERECPEMVRAECDSALTDLKTAIPTLLVAVLDQDRHDLSGASLVLDGHSVALDGSTVEVDPGTHQLTASSGTLSSQLEVIAIESDLNRRVELVLGTPHTDEPPKELWRVEPAPVARRSKAPAYILGGVAAAAAASFGYFALSGHSEMGRLNECKPYCNPDDVRRVRTQYLAADMSLGVSLLALAGAAYWLMSPGSEAPQPKSAVSLGVTALPGRAGIALRWLE